MPEPDRAPSRSLRDLLRAETREAHARVDRAFLRFDLASRRGIAAFLTIQARVVPALEAAVEARGVEALLPDWLQRRRAEALAADLADLGAPWPQEPAPIASVRDEAELMGTVYVLESARLGGVALARRAAQAQDPVVRAAVRYLAHGQGAGLWPRFVARLNADPVAVSRPDRVAAAALSALAAFEYALDEAD